jgi:hypothetical protein
LSYKEKIVKKCLQRAFFLSIVQLSGEKWSLVGTFALISYLPVPSLVSS